MKRKGWLILAVAVMAAVALFAVSLSSPLADGSVGAPPGDGSNPCDGDSCPGNPPSCPDGSDCPGNPPSCPDGSDCPGNPPSCPDGSDCPGNPPSCPDGNNSCDGNGDNANR